MCVFFCRHSRHFILICVKGIVSPFDLAEELRNTANLQHISYHTLEQRFRDDGIYGRRPSKSNYLTDVRKAERIRFAPEHIHYTVEFWQKEIFQTKKHFPLMDINPQWVHRLPGGRHEPSNFSRSNNSTRKTIDVWGYVSYHGPRVLHREGRLNTLSYLEIVRDKLVPYVVENFPLPDFEDPELRVIP